MTEEEKQDRLAKYEGIFPQLKASFEQADQDWRTTLSDKITPENLNSNIKKAILINQNFNKAHNELAKTKNIISLIEWTPAIYLTDELINLIK